MGTVGVVFGGFDRVRGRASVRRRLFGRAPVCSLGHKCGVGHARRV